MWPFKRRQVVHETTTRELFGLIKHLESRLDEQDERHERLVAQHLSLRGRVYAIWGKGGSSDDAAAPPAGTQNPSGETKAQLRARLLAEGKLVPGKPYKHSN